MGAQRVKSHELTQADIDRMREEEAHPTEEQTQEIGGRAIQLAQGAENEQIQRQD